MTDHTLLVLTLVGVGAILAGLAVVWWLVLQRTHQRDAADLKSSLADELRAERQEAAAAARDQRAELQTGLKGLGDSLVGGISEMRDASEHLRESLSASVRDLQTGNERKLEEVRAVMDEKLKVLVESMMRGIGEIREATERLRESLSSSVRDLQAGNEKKLDEMRTVVDEKLQGTLEKRLGESFALVSEQLEAVHRGLGEMRTLATGVGDLKKVLSNVKTRGTFGEMQLHAILEQILSPEQYRENFAPREESGDRVEFAIVLPGRDGGGEPVYLPVDSKFPQEDFVRLVEAADHGDADAMVQARSDLVRQVRAYAKSVSEKYVNPPVTTDFAVVFLPTEGLYAEVLRQPSLVEDLQRCSVMLAGPTTFAAFLSCLRMGFRTLAIQQRSSQVWQVLGAVKTEFAKFGEVITKVKKQLGSATATLDETSRRTRAMERKLREVEELPPDLSARLIGLPAGGEAEAQDEEGQEEQEDAQVLHDRLT